METQGDYNYDAHLDRACASYDPLVSDARADAECAVHDASRRWLRENLEAIRELFADWEQCVTDAWEGECSEPFEDDDLPMCAIRDLFEDAEREVQQHEYNKRQGRHLGRY